MAVTSPEDFNAFSLMWFYSSHNIGEESSCGGAKSANQISQLELHNLFTKVVDAQADLGKTTFKCIYIYNDHPREPIRNPILIIPENSASTDDELAVGWGLAPINGVEQTITTESSPPPLITFKLAPTRTEGSILGRNIPPKSWKSLWVRRVVNFNAQEYPRNGAVVRLLTDNIVQEVIDAAEIEPPSEDFSWTEHGEHDLNEHWHKICDHVRHRNSNLNCTTGNMVTATAGNASASAGGGMAIARAGNCMAIAGNGMLNLTKFCFGKDDCDNKPQENHWRNRWGLKHRHHSWQEQNIHFLVMDTAMGKQYWDESSLQYEFIKRDLAGANADPQTDWIVVLTNRVMYASPTNTSTKYILKDLRDLYHPLFEQNNVHFVIQGYIRNFQRSYILKWNEPDSDQPVILNQGNDPDYTIPLGKESFDDGTGGTGCIFITNGTGGRGHDNVSSLAAFTSHYNAIDYGYMYWRHKNTDTYRKITGTFHDLSNRRKDNVSITKQLV